MRKQILIAGLLLITAISFGQKKEIKKAEKAIKSGNFTEATSLLKQVEGQLSGIDNELKAQYFVALGNLKLANAGKSSDKLKEAGDAYQEALKVNPNGKSASAANDGINNLRVSAEENAKSSYSAKNYKDAAKSYYTVYEYDKNDTIYLYNASICSSLAKDNDLSLLYYKKLIDIGYTGMAEEFVATNKNSGEVTPFKTKEERNLAVKAGEYIKPEVRNSKSLQGDIFRNLTAVYIDLGENDKAITLLNKLIAESPNDFDLLNIASSMYYKLGDFDNFNKMTKKLIELRPNDENLYFNLGVTNSKNGNKEEALKYYSKAIEINPNYSAALINKAQIILEGETVIIEEMNGLGTSSADYDRYDALKEKKNELYREAIPFLEKASDLRSDDVELARTLKNIYELLGMDDKAKLMKTRIESNGGQ
ncbi:MAG: tetratricopeptide repeat protein [Flavobacteriaceae bacterium]|nr:tetratricopeptide repeat protein [Flavobacteriaceae bacterium]